VTSVPLWAAIGLLVLAALLAASATAANLALTDLTQRVTHLEHQVCLLQHRPPDCRP
jgi:hypothetical protein